MIWRAMFDYVSKGGGTEKKKNSSLGGTYYIRKKYDGNEKGDNPVDEECQV